MEVTMAEVDLSMSRTSSMSSTSSCSARVVHTPSPSATTGCPAQTSNSDHKPRSGTEYAPVTEYVPGVPRSLRTAFQKCYIHFAEGHRIPPQDILALSHFHVTQEEFSNLIIRHEITRNVHISLENYKIILDQNTDKPHGEIIGEVTYQISHTDRTAGHYLVMAIGNRMCVFSQLVLTADVQLGPGDTKAPDAHWSLDKSKIPMNLLPHYPTNPRSGDIAPCLVFEIAVSNESLRRLTVTDVSCYFQAGTGTRAWVGIKVFKDSKNQNPNHQWWAGWGTRDIDATGKFQNSATLHQESFPMVMSHNVPLATPCNITFHISTDILFHPMAVPQGIQIVWILIWNR